MLLPPAAVPKWGVFFPLSRTFFAAEASFDQSVPVSSRYAAFRHGRFFRIPSTIAQWRDRVAKDRPIAVLFAGRPRGTGARSGARTSRWTIVAAISGMATLASVYVFADQFVGMIIPSGGTLFSATGSSAASNATRRHTLSPSHR